MSTIADDYDTLDVGPHPEDERICLIQLDQPDRNNVIDLDIIVDLRSAIRAADNDDSIYGMILGSSSDDVFCVGGDVKELSNLSLEASNRFLNTYVESIELMLNTGKPVVAAVNGACVGGGNELVMGCDLIIAGESARFGQPEVSIGSTAAAGGIQMLPLLIGMQRTKDLLYTARILSAEEALDWGLINRVVPDNEVRRETLDVVQSILDRASPNAFRVMKSAFNHWNNIAMANQAMDREITARIWNSEDFRQRAQAFLDKEDMEPGSFTGTLPSEE